MNVVWFAEIKWDYLRTRKQQLIRRRPADVDLLFLEPYVRGRENRHALHDVDGIRAATIPFIKNIPSGPVRAAMNLPPARSMVDTLARERVRDVLRRANINPREAIFVISNVYAIGAAGAFSPRRLVYDCNDAHADFPGMPAWTRDYQERTLREAERVIVSARRLREDAVRVRGSDSNVFTVGNGVDHAMFQQSIALRRHDATDRLRVGYLGAIAPWFDFDLVEGIARERPEWELRLVGPVLPGAGPMVERLARQPNVNVGPAVAHDDVPGVLAEFDIGLIPFRLTPLTAGVNPNKLYEYLASGLPVVSTPFSPEVVAETDLVALANSSQEFVAACEHMLVSRSDEADRARLTARAGEIAAGYDWGRIAEMFWQAVCG